MKKVVKHALSCILVLTMILALIPSVPLSAWAEDSSSGQNDDQASFSDQLCDEFIKSKYIGCAKEEIRKVVVDIVYRLVAQKDVPGASGSFEALMANPPPNRLTYNGLDHDTIDNWSKGIKYVISIHDDVSKMATGIYNLLDKGELSRKALSDNLAYTLEGFFGIANTTIGLLLPEPVSTVVTVPIKVGKVLMGPVKECIELYNDHWSQLRDVLYELDGPDDPDYQMLVGHTGEKTYEDTLNALDQNDITLFEGFISKYGDYIDYMEAYNGKDAEFAALKNDVAKFKECQALCKNIVDNLYTYSTNNPDKVSEFPYAFYIDKNGLLRRTNNVGNFLGIDGSISQLEDGVDAASKLRTTDPLIIDLDENGVETLPLSKGVYFDHQGNGFKIKTGWAGPNEGFIVRDLNGNGKIDNGGELFGNNTLLKNGALAANGFEALKDLDDNQDSIFDENDTAFNELYVWVDANSNGKSSKDELIPFKETGITSISLQYDEIDFTDSHGNVFRQSSTAVKTDGKIVDIADVWFTRSPRESISKDMIEVSDEVRALPDIRGYGTTYSLHQAMMRDSSGQLQSLVEQFAVEKDESARRALVVQIIYKWTGKTNNLAAAEALVGTKYTGGTGSNAMAIVNRAFDKVANAVYHHLMAKTHLDPLYQRMVLTGDYKDPMYDLSDVATYILDIISADQKSGEKLLMDFVTNMYAIGILDSVDLKGFYDILDKHSPRYGYIIDMATKNIIYGTDGNDRLVGTSGGDTFLAEKGDNTIDGGLGDDTFYFGKESGINTISSSGGNNTILFWDDIQPEDIQLRRMSDANDVPTNDVEVIIGGCSGKIIIKNYFPVTSSYTFSFLNGTTYDSVNFFDYIEIQTAEQLNTIRNNRFGNYRLVADIDLAGIDWTPIGTSEEPFCGILDGNGHTISNPTVNRADQDYTGLFGYSMGLVRNLTIDNAQITGKQYTGILAGYNKGMFSNCTVTGGSLSGGDYTGGLIGQSNGTITGCKVTGVTSLSGGGNTGGLIGQNNGSVTDCSVTKIIGLNGKNNIGGLIGINYGTVRKSYSTVSVQGNANVGGLIGYSSGGLIEQCYATGHVVAQIRAGGFVGTLDGTVRNCFSTGNVACVSDAAGFMGETYNNAKVENCYSTSNHVNGFAPNSFGTNCYFDKDMSMNTTSEQGRTTEEMMKKETYEGWDFDTIWTITDGYPTLRGMKGTKVEYIEIQTAEQLNAIRNDRFGNYRLVADIDLAGIDWTPIGTSEESFCGILDGNGHTISNPTVNRADQDYTGLFGYSMGLVRNLTIDNAQITGKQYTGVLVGCNKGSILNCTVSGGSLTGTYCSDGLIGENTGSVIGCSATGVSDLSGGDSTGDEPEINGIYSISARHSGQYLDIYNGNTSAGTKVIQYFKTDAANQKFRLTDAGDGYFYIEPLNSKGMSLCAPDASNSDKSVTIDTKDTSNNRQKFTFVKSDDGTYIIKPMSDLTQCFDIANGSHEYCASLLLWSAHGSDNQRWILERDFNL